jgi:glycosyltransferase involved in cell wall biosynthesis
LAISCSEWGKPILIANGAAPARVKIIPQGVPNDFVAAAKNAISQRPARTIGKPFTIGYIGRVTPVKGVDILAEGFSRVQGDDLRLKIFGFVKNEKNVGKLNDTLAALSSRDSRIELCPRLSLAEMAGVYSELDLIAIPSVWLETGPFVLFEALQMGIPVFGSNRLGHPRLLKNGGMVVEPNTADGWQKALSDAAKEFRTGQWEKRRENIRTQIKMDTMDDVAAEMAADCGNLMKSQAISR